MPRPVTKSNLDELLERLQTALNCDVSSQWWNSTLAALWVPSVMALPTEVSYGWWTLRRGVGLVVYNQPFKRKSCLQVKEDSPYICGCKNWVYLGRGEKEELSLIYYAQNILCILSPSSDFEIIVLKACGFFFFFSLSVKNDKWPQMGPEMALSFALSESILSGWKKCPMKSIGLNSFEANSWKWERDDDQDTDVINEAPSQYVLRRKEIRLFL